MKTGRFCGQQICLAGVLFGLSALPQFLTADDLNLEVSIVNDQVQLDWDAVVGRTYSVERSETLTGTWPDVATVVPTTAAGTWTDPDELGSNGRFYRLSYDPNDDGQPGNELFVFPDGDFEGYENFGSLWFQATPYNNQPQIIQNTEGFPITARSGESFAWLGGALNLDPSTSNNQSIIQYSQSLQMPVNTPIYLHVWYQIVSEEQDTFADLFNLWVADILALGPFCQTNLLLSTTPITSAGNTNGWTRASFNLSALQGQIICLAFEVRTNFALNSNLFIDDISFRDLP